MIQKYKRKNSDAIQLRAKGNHTEVGGSTVVGTQGLVARH